MRKAGTHLFKVFSKAPEQCRNGVHKESTGYQCDEQTQQFVVRCEGDEVSAGITKYSGKHDAHDKEGIRQGHVQ